MPGPAKSMFVQVIVGLGSEPPPAASAGALRRKVAERIRYARAGLFW